MMKTETELFEHFLKNEQKQKKTTILSAILFVIFAIAIVILSIYVSKQEKVIEQQKTEIEDCKAKLSKMKVEDLQIFIDTAEIVKNQKFEIVKDSLTTSRNFEKDRKPASLENQILNSTATKSSPEELYQEKHTLYIQYMDGFNNEVNKIIFPLKKSGFIIRETELIKTIKFKSSVRYFYPEDKKKADDIAKLAEEVTNLKFNVQYTKIEAPKNQIEIWIGEYNY